MLENYQQIKDDNLKRKIEKILTLDWQALEDLGKFLFSLPNFRFPGNAIQPRIFCENPGLIISENSGLIC